MLATWAVSGSAGAAAGAAAASGIHRRKLLGEEAARRLHARNQGIERSELGHVVGLYRREMRIQGCLLRLVVGDLGIDAVGGIGQQTVGAEITPKQRIQLIGKAARETHITAVA